MSFHSTVRVRILLPFLHRVYIVSDFGKHTMHPPEIICIFMMWCRIVYIYICIYSISEIPRLKTTDLCLDLPQPLHFAPIRKPCDEHRSSSTRSTSHNGTAIAGMTSKLFNKMP